MILPTRRAAVILAALAVATAAAPVPWAVFAIAAAALAGAVVADGLLARHRRPTLERTLTATLARATPTRFVAAVDRRGARRVRIRQPAPPELAVTPNEAEGTSLEGTLTGRWRGRHTLGPIVVRSTGPLGFGAADHRVGDAVDTTVLPDLPRARRLAEARPRGAMAEDGRVRARLGLGTEFETIRDYSPDDDIRQVNWVATARVGRPMSNQYRIDENRDVMCVVDTGRLMGAPIGDVDAMGRATRLDVALDAMAVLAVSAEDAGDRVGALAFADGVRRDLAPRRRGAAIVVRALSDLEATDDESDYRGAFQRVSDRKRALIALFTDLMDEHAARTLIEAAPALVRRHAVMVATSVDPDLAAAASSVPNRPFDVFRAAAAIDLFESRQRALARLRKMGVVVVEAAPDRLGPAAVAGYLMLKRRARV